MLLTDPKYRILRLGTISAIVYCLMFALLPFSELIAGIFIFTMLFLPGVTFALVTGNYSKLKLDFSGLRIFLHLTGSIAIYYINLNFFFENESSYGGFIFGFAGSFAYLLITRILLNVKMDVPLFFLTAFGSGVVLYPVGRYDDSLLLTGICVMVWTIVNAGFLNYSHGKNGDLG